MNDVIKGMLVLQIEMEKRHGVLGTIQKELVDSIKDLVEEYFELEKSYLELMEEIDEFLKGFPSSGCDYDCDCNLADWEVEFSKG